MPSSNSSPLKSGAVLDKFPAGLRVLVIDDDSTCLMMLKQMLTECNYEATVCNRAVTGLSLLRENKNGYDVVLSDVHMPDMDGFKLLEHIGLEMDLPVIMMSADYGQSLVMKGITQGACDYLIKPICIETLRNIWQHVVRRRIHEWKAIEPPLASADDVDQHQKHQKVSEDVDQSSSGNEGHNWKKSKRLNDGEEQDGSSSKKPRLVWTVELHQQFVAAINMIGINKAVPKRILELMNVPGLSRENVANHLQKYRKHLRDLNESQQLRSINTPIMVSPDSGYGSLSSLSGLDLQGMANGQLPGQSLATLDGAVLGSSSNSNSQISIPANQRNVFSFEDSNSRYEEVNTSHFLHGIPTNMGPKQFSNVNSHKLIPIGSPSQSQSQSQHQSRQPILSDGMFTNGLGMRVSGGSIDPSYNIFNDSNPITPPQDSGFEDMMFNNGLTYSANKNFPTSFLAGDESGTHINGFGNNRDELLPALILKQQQQQGCFRQPENEFVYGGLDDLWVT
ncbi:two-component response regulator ARR2-like [Rutidosis leptorrhynchoides]|uniref:two-component response regulator ARR2-like n=1 Tax=Rutidosis leptorrhynchoides TaxID=125765 RepID=UPI003A9922F8